MQPLQLNHEFDAEVLAAQQQMYPSIQLQSETNGEAQLKQLPNFQQTYQLHRPPSPILDL